VGICDLKVDSVYLMTQINHYRRHPMRHTKLIRFSPRPRRPLSSNRANSEENLVFYMMNRAVSLRSSKGRHDTPPVQSASKIHRFTFGSLRGNMQPNLSKRLYKLIKTENVVISVVNPSLLMLIIGV
jgi:hypothetical protein